MIRGRLKTAILPKLLTGARDGLPLDAIGATDPLQALALAAQALRFDRPPQPLQFQVEDVIAHNATIMPDAARKLLIRLMTGKGQASASLSAAIVRKLVERKLRLHPFDLPKLETFVKAHAEDLGAEALAFSEREKPVAQKQNYFAPDRLSDENWMLATPAVKAGYISGRRAIDPDAARALVEAVWKTEDADSRFRLLGAFRERLSEADAPFLKSLEKDRAPRVRALAQRLIVKLPGFEGSDPALREVVERIKVSKSGLIFKKTVLTLELPATVRDHTKRAWLNQAFGPIGLEMLAGALSLSVEAMIAAAEKQNDLLLAFFLMATQDGRLDVVEMVTDGHLPDAWALVDATDDEALADYNQDMRRAWVAHVFRPDRWGSDTTPWVIRRMAMLLAAEATEKMFADVLRSKPWLALRKPNAGYDADIIDDMAAMCPPAMRPALRTEFAALDPAKTGNAILFLDLMNSLETDHV